jgi:pyruvate ferredoxin oxidoreductase gamma subunit
MLRVRFHGRGGQGMKTAGRILGSAAFRAGLTVQDSPVYGAERRGAAMSAFTRISRGPIRERGPIGRPDLVVVADDTLFDDPAAQPLAGCGEGATLLVNTARPATSFAAGEGLRALSADFTGLALRRTGTLASLSTALGVASARLAGLTLEDALRGLGDELDDLGLAGDRRAANIELAREAHALVSSWPPVLERPPGATPSRELAEIPYEPPVRAAPTITAVANTPQRATGHWRQFRPVLDRDACTRCWLCFVACPEGAISLDRDEYPVVDYAVCKGCLLCAEECPTGALPVEKEAR